MSGIDPTQRLLAQIRAALSARTDKQRSASPSSAKSPPSKAEGKDFSEQLSHDIRAAIREIHLDGEDGRRRGRKAFVEVVLLDEFGIALANDPRFPQIVEKVEAVIVDENELRTELDRLLMKLASS